MVWEKQYRWGRGFRGSLIVCRRVGLIVRTDSHLGLSSWKARRDVLARFHEGVDPRLRRELEQLACADELEAERVAEWLEPIRVIAADRREDLDVTGALCPPMRRRGSLDELDFPLRETTSPDRTGRA